MKIIKRVVLFLGAVFIVFMILALAAFITVKRLKIKDIVEQQIEDSLGVKVAIESIDFSPLLARVGAKNVTIFNPAGFEEKELGFIESIYIVVDPLEVLTKKKPDIYLFALDLKRLSIIKNSEGKVNIKEVLPASAGGGNEDENPPFYFDVVVLSIGDINYVQYEGRAKKEKAYHIGIKDAAFVGLQDTDQVVQLVVYNAIKNTDIGQLINLSIKPLITQLGTTVNAAWGTARTGVKTIWNIATFPLKLIFN